MKNFLAIVCFVVATTTAIAQTDTSSVFKWDEILQWDEITWDESLNMFYEPGYITTGGGFGNIEPLLFEANIIPYYRISFDAVKKWAFLISPQVVLRMYNDYSYPVKTPSYEPRIILVHQSSEHTREYHDWFQYISWFHHSNGQDGYFYTDSTNTHINYENGSFSTNWLEAGIFASRAHSSRQYYSKLSGRYCYQRDTMLNGLYGRWRLNFEITFDWNIAKTLSNLNIPSFDGKETVLSNTIKFGLICGNIEDYEFLDFQRCIFDYTISFKPGFLQDVTLFAQYYWGEDYYNIYFNRILRVFRVGIAAQSKFFVKNSTVKKN
ncbi:MAG: hypothetical protein J6Y55_01040 [Bacteroidales bacterium]|nr:hypothetical protein [Bacteroidales bacterium]